MTQYLKNDHIDFSTFEQILELDDGDSRDIDSFSGTIVASFFQQAETTFTELETAVHARDFESLSRLGHFLKGSSATLGLHRIRDACEKIQNLGAGKDESGLKDLNDKDYAIQTIQSNITSMKQDYAEAASALKKFYKIE